MNERFDKKTTSQTEMLDRLVDGELTPAEEQQLLAALDAQGDGWRHCALAFIEARQWKADFAALVASPPASVNGKCQPIAISPSAQPDAKRMKAVIHPRPAGQWFSPLALAASIAVAFFGGMLADQQWQTAALRSSTHEPKRSPANVAVSDKNSPNALPGRAVSQEDQLASMLNVALVDDQGNVERQLVVPVMDADQLDASWLQYGSQAIPEHVVQALRRNGHTVEEQRLLVPVWLNDGRPAIVPVDRAQVKFAGLQF